MIIHSYRPSALLRVTGDDAAGYLQGQFTNELRQPIGAAVFGLWLNQKGKVLADSSVLKQGENEFTVVSIHSTAAVIRARLEEYIVADDVTLTDESNQVQALSVAGRGCSAIIQQCLGAMPLPGHFLQRDERVVFAGRRSRDENYELFGPAAVTEETKSKLLALGAREAGAEEMEFMRISAGRPAVPQDIGPGDLPNEGGLEVEAISYTKGCYLGQEVMARLKNMGQVRRRLHRIHGSGAAPEALAPLYQRGKQVGQIRSIARQGNEFVALAMLSFVNLDPASGLGLAPNAAPAVRIIPHG
ncbi:MAG: folate-binding protein [Lacunisphaera sp.]|nr:folate-binding protein [Lacunisphaera sp.]